MSAGAAWAETGASAQARTDMDAATDTDNATAMPVLQALSLHCAGPVWHLRLNRPEVRNAMSLAMVDELGAVLAHAEACAAAGGPQAPRVLVLRGAGGHFCAGADLRDMAAARMREAAGQADATAEVNARFGRLCAAWAATGLATVAVLDGTVMGGGLGLACVVDVALAGPDVSLRLPETALGLLPAQIAPWLVQRLGLSQAQRLAVTGGRLGAAQALRIGLVHEALPDAAALDAALADTLRDILACAPGALAATKALMALAAQGDPARLIDGAARQFAACARGAEGLEGTAAFLQKRPPAWAVAPHRTDTGGGITGEAPTGAASTSHPAPTPASNPASTLATASRPSDEPAR